ncbi:hypothetical protein BG006_001553 [Podila minutissima]|uniref:GH16 domain-containing protein n=1 Tax=Podila minutissima TaxID=64525 RepID=A0A9P5VGP3_9FUNG|nr:hypothetical protein BG006_001553 [Podila minutissima]
MKLPLPIAVLSTVLAMISSSSSLKINDTQVIRDPVPNPNPNTTIELLPLMSSGYNENTLEDDSFNNNSTIISAFAKSPSSSPFFEPLTTSLSAFIIPHDIGPSRWSCKYNRNEVHASPQGTQISIGRQSSLKPFSCGELISRETRLDYGVYSIDMISTSVPGHVTAFFLIANGVTEIDVELTGLNSKVFWANVWQGHKQNPTKIPLGFDAAKGWHTYAVEWRKDFIAWYVDGKQVLKRSDIGTADPKKADYRLAFNSWTQGLK